ncbi:MAG TPA: cytochrome o ubiquinol oxidase subunit IV [Steroidobacteraceae bacterium]|jgi:cytochrome o ubiquinol oxidase operon protein cyoD|nr:cytochrome o ubiquinol oxidase subunit IV [Steroidobacteraceae bacterium]
MSAANEAVAGRAPHGVLHAGAHGAAHGHGTHGSRTSYLVGFLLAIALTIVPFGLVMTHSAIGTPLIISVFALLQIGVHVVYFLHVNRSQEQRWNLVALVFTAIVVCIIVGGSLWIMHNLYINMVPGMMQGSMG